MWDECKHQYGQVEVRYWVEGSCAGGGGIPGFLTRFLASMSKGDVLLLSLLMRAGLCVRL